jgi:hypothetical protein
MADLTAAGAGTGTQATTIAYNVIFQDPNATTTQTVSSVGTFSTDSATNFNGTPGFIAVSAGTQAYVFRASSGTAIQVSTTYVRGGGLTTGPTVRVYAALESLGP